MRGFLWKGRKDIKGGHCLVGWQRVCRPRKLGGLGIHDMEVMGWALSMRWLWLKKIQPTRPWAAFEVQVHPKAVAMFDFSVQAVVGDGATILFWMDKWIQGKSIADLVPELVAAVPRRFLKQRTVQEALSSGVWVNDIKRDLSDQFFSAFASGFWFSKFSWRQESWINIFGHPPRQANIPRSRRMTVSLQGLWALSWRIGSGIRGRLQNVSSSSGWQR
jgi:hypothetical protein